MASRDLTKVIIDEAKAGGAEVFTICSVCERKYNLETEKGNIEFPTDDGSFFFCGVDCFGVSDVAKAFRRAGVQPNLVFE